MPTSRKGGLLAQSDDDDSDTPDLDLPSASSTRAKKTSLFKRRNPIDEYSASNTECITINCALSSVIVALVIAMVALTMYTFAICKELAEFRQTMSDAQASEKTRLLEFTEKMQQLRQEVDLLRDDTGIRNGTTATMQKNTARGLIQEQITRIADQLTEYSRNLQYKAELDHKNNEGYTTELKLLTRRISILELCAALHSCETAPPGNDSVTETKKRGTESGPLEGKVRRQSEKDAQQLFVFSRVKK